MRKAVTIKQVADQAGCSFAVVAKVLNGAKGNVRVSEDLTERIRTVARRLGYHTNYHAQGLKLRRAQAIGLLPGDDLTTSLQFKFWSTLIDGIQREVRLAGHDLVMIGGGDERQDTIARAIRSVHEQRIDAFIIIGLMPPEQLARLASLDLPHVVLFGKSPLFTPHFGVDHGTGILAALHHLQELGHREVLWAGDAHPFEAKGGGRRELFVKLSARLGLRGTVARIPILTSGLDGQIRAARLAFAAHLATRRSPPTAIMAFNDLIALGVYEALKERDLRIPEDVSVIGYDDEYAALASPAMTSVNQSLFELGRQGALRALAAGAGQPNERGAGTLIPSTLTVRLSTGPARQEPGYKGR